MSKADTIDAVALVLSAFAIALQALLAALVVAALAALASPRARAFLRGLPDVFGGALIWIAWAIAAVATAGSLFFSEYAEFVPCGLCWYQRIAMYPLVVILLVAGVRRDFAGAAAYGLPLALIGAVVSAWHIYIEINPEAETGFCSIGETTSCAVKWIEELGFVTIPVLALTAFASIAVLLAGARWRDRHPAP